MAKKQLIWSPKARITLLAILKFYAKRNGSSTYSKKIYTEINHRISLLLAFPKLGKETNDKRFRTLVHGVYKTYYEIRGDRIIIHMVWDTRQNPEDLNL